MNLRIGTFLTAILAVLAATRTAGSRLKVHPGVHRVLRKQSTVDVIVTLTETTDAVLESIRGNSFPTRTARIEALTHKLQAQSKSAASEVVETLSRHDSSSLHKGFQTFWISNQVAIESAAFELIETLIWLPSVADIRVETPVTLDFPYFFPYFDNKVSGAQHRGHAWGTETIGAPQVWSSGATGQGIVVASIDSGVRSSHDTLKRNFQFPYLWYDPERKSTEPYDVNGHGTHTMALIAGAKGVGVAPGAKWLTCKGCRADGCREPDLLACAQFVLCPTDPRGNNADCSQAPHVVSNSWSGPSGDDWFQPVVDAWVAAGIIPVFSLGNTGEACGTTRSPGDYRNVIGVGATMPSDEIASFSSKGPSVSGRGKPDIVAPGFAIRSAYFGDDTSYIEGYGTSMAASYVAGAIALLLSARPNLTVDEVKHALFASAQQMHLDPSNATCGGTSDNQWPNNQYGHGRLNVLDAYERVRPTDVVSWD
ncbi:hypothetical protein FI667_g11092, partial [Globisporangium splendens]